MSPPSTLEDLVAGAVVTGVDPAGAERDVVRCLRRPFDGRDESHAFDMTSFNFTWSAL